MQASVPPWLSNVPPASTHRFLLTSLPAYAGLVIASVDRANAAPMVAHLAIFVQCLRFKCRRTDPRVTADSPSVGTLDAWGACEPAWSHPVSVNRPIARTSAVGRLRRLRSGDRRPSGAVVGLPGRGAPGQPDGPRSPRRPRRRPPRRCRRGRRIRSAASSAPKRTNGCPRCGCCTRDRVRLWAALRDHRDVAWRGTGASAERPRPRTGWGGCVAVGGPGRQQGCRGQHQDRQDAGG